MPIYEYECNDCGTFDRLRPVSEASLASECPSCGAPAGRIISAPQLRVMGSLNRMAAERNEKSRHEPHVCSSSCGHHHATNKKSVAADPGRPKRHAYKGPRPWVIEHR